MKAEEISQADLAKAAGVSREIMDDMNGSEASPSIDVAKKIADAM